MQQKTIREWLNELPPLCRDLALYEAERIDSSRLSLMRDNLHQAIIGMFTWQASSIGSSFWIYLYEWVCEHHPTEIKIHSKEKTATSQAILNEHKAHFTASTRTVLIAMLKGRTLDKHSGISGNISSRVSDLIRENHVPIVKTRKLRSNGKLAYFRYHIAEADRAELIERFKLNI